VACSTSLHALLKGSNDQERNNKSAPLGFKLMTLDSLDGLTTELQSHLIILGSKKKEVTSSKNEFGLNLNYLKAFLLHL